MDYILAAVIESVDAYKSGVIDSKELLEDLRRACDQIAEQDHICQIGSVLSGDGTPRLVCHRFLFYYGGNWKNLLTFEFMIKYNYNLNQFRIYSGGLDSDKINRRNAHET